MGPVEIIFLVAIAIFGVIGIVRGYSKELGVTTVLLVVLLVIVLGESRLADQLGQLFGAIGGQANVGATKAWVYTVLLVAVAFISYQGETLSFPGNGRIPLLGLLVGLLNGYLLAGSIWHFMDKAKWAGVPVDTGHYTELYRVAITLVPPAVLPWWFLILLLAVMLVLRVWK